MTDKQIDKHIPRLRFPEFHNDDEWTEKRFGDCLEYEQPQPYLVASDNYKRTGTPVLTAGKTFVLGYTDEITGIYNHLPVIIFDDFTTASKFVDFPFKAKSSAMKMLQNRNGYDLRFMFESIQNHKFEPKDHQRHWINIFSQFKILVPSYSEQQKIADCLFSIDSYISSINEKKEQLKAHKKSLMQKLFPQNGKTVPEYRFPEFAKDGAWTEKKLGDYLVEHKMKNDGQCEVYSVSVSKGVVNQIDYLGRSFSASDTSKYKLVKPFDIIYTKSPTGSFPYGIIKQSFIAHNVIVSPLYGVFSPLNKYIGYIIHSYFESPERTNNYLAPIVKKGAKNTIQISNDTFLSQTVCFPSNPKEQRKIAEGLFSISKIIKLYTAKINYLESQKQGLIQRLFPN